MSLASLMRLILLFSFTTFGKAASVNDELTAEERALLQTRSQQQRVDVITTQLPAQQQLLVSPSRPIKATAPELAMLVEQMRKAMLAHEGTGLTAVQIGIPVRVVLMMRTINGSRYFHSFINPEIVHISANKIGYWERCLSLPQLSRHLIQRAAHLTVRYQKIGGQLATETFTGSDAAVMQQELDHLQGVLLTDHHPAD